MLIGVLRSAHLFEDFPSVESITQFVHGSLDVVQRHHNRDPRASVAAFGNSQVSIPNTSNWSPERTKQGINLSRSFEVNKMQTTCNRMTHSLACKNSMGSSIT